MGLLWLNLEFRAQYPKNYKCKNKKKCVPMKLDEYN